MRQHESGERLEAFVARQADVIFGFQIADVGRAIEHHRGIAGGERWLGLVELVFDFADQLREDVFDGDHAGGGAEFVDDDGEMALALLELHQEVGEGLGLGNHQHFAHEVTHLDVAEAALPQAGSHLAETIAASSASGRCA